MEPNENFATNNPTSNPAWQNNQSQPPLTPAMPGAPTMPEPPVAPATSTAPTTPETPNQPTPPAKPKKKTNAMLLAVILLGVVAVGGVGFGVWEMISSNQRIDNLNAQLTKLQQTNNDLLDQIDNLPTDNGDTAIINITDGDTVNTSDYIYMGDFGVKIQKPSDWQTLVRGYSYYNDGVAAYVIEENSDTEYANVSITYGCSEGSTCITVGNSNLTITVGETASAALADYFSNPENYSAI